jgi:hypothetical protein
MILEIYVKLGTGTINLCHGLGQAQYIYVMAWDGPNKSMSWLGTGTINLCHSLGQAQ